jgi:hydroxymethylpyrimidine pyrophosphatase-like HAD family hydrolase
MAEPTVAALRLRDPIIISGGALIVDPQDATQLYSSPLPENSMDNLLPVLTELNINRVLWDDYREEDFVSGGLALRDLPAAHHPYFLNLPMVKDSVLQELLRRVRELTGVRALPMRGLWQDHHEVHVLSTFATKYHAVKILQQHFGVTTEETVGIGDGHNDMDLFDAVGHAVAVDNAVEPLRQRAHELIGHVNENGLTHYLNTLAR